MAADEISIGLQYELTRRGLTPAWEDKSEADRVEAVNVGWLTGDSSGTAYSVAGVSSGAMLTGKGAKVTVRAGVPDDVGAVELADTSDVEVLILRCRM